FAPRKLLLVDEPPYLVPKSRESREAAEGEAEPPDESGEKAAARLERFIERERAGEAPSRIIIFRSAAVDRRRRLFKLLEKKGLVVECAPLRGTELSRWIRDWLARQGKKIEPAALQRLLWSGENDLHFLSNELEKYCAYLGDGEMTITAEALELLFSGDIKSSVFTLTDALSEGKPGRALQVLSQLLAGKREEPLRIFFMLVRHFRLLLGARSLRDEKVPPAQHPGALGVKPFEARKLYGQSAAFSRETLEEIIIFLQQLDYRIKTGRVIPAQALEIAIAQIHHLSPRR
ncbi:MAG: DNA polymerase III subunit delta, partial [Firmicutes bacterium]|nr:DNA polymerase III subunit delta [Bacillota bacterium]